MIIKRVFPISWPLVRNYGLRNRIICQDLSLFFNSLDQFTENDKNVVYGIASWQIGCGTSDVGNPAGVFNEVFSHIDFIKDVIVRFQKHFKFEHQI